MPKFLSEMLIEADESWDVFAIESENLSIPGGELIAVDLGPNAATSLEVRRKSVPSNRDPDYGWSVKTDSSLRKEQVVKLCKFVASL